MAFKRGTNRWKIGFYNPTPSNGLDVANNDLLKAVLDPNTTQAQIRAAWDSLAAKVAEAGGVMDSPYPFEKVV